MSIQRTEIKQTLLKETIGKDIVVKGWVRNHRGNNYVLFVSLNDGSCFESLQIVVEIEKFAPQTIKNITVGSALSVFGTLQISEGKGQAVELQAKTIEVLGTADPEKY